MVTPSMLDSILYRLPKNIADMRSRRQKLIYYGSPSMLDSILYRLPKNIADMRSRRQKLIYYGHTFNVGQYFI